MRASRPITLVLYDRHLMSLESLAAAFDEDPTVAIVATTTRRNDLPDILEQRRPGICIIDVTTADTDCIAVLAELGRRAPGAALVLLVDDVPTSFVRKAIRAGVRGFARKDASLHSLRKTIDCVATGRSLVGADALGRLPNAPSHNRPRPAPPSTLDQLTEREQEVLDRIMAGDDTRHIAAALKISRSTARTHVQNVRRKLGARTKLQAVALALGTTPTWPDALLPATRCG